MIFEAISAAILDLCPVAAGILIFGTILIHNLWTYKRVSSLEDRNVASSTEEIPSDELESEGGSDAVDISELDAAIEEDEFYRKIR